MTMSYVVIQRHTGGDSVTGVSKQVNAILPQVPLSPRSNFSPLILWTRLKLIILIFKDIIS